MSGALGVVAIGRKTFDVELAQTIFERAMASLERLERPLVVGDSILYEPDDLPSVLARLQERPLERLIVLQLTFADAGMVLALAHGNAAPFFLWGFPETRWGGRPRLNALCGINLAAHALGRAGHPYSWLYAPPDADARLAEALERPPPQAPDAVDVLDEPAQERAAEDVLEALHGRRIGLVGEHPPGFETCRFDEEWLKRELGIAVERIALPTVFERARALHQSDLDAVRARVARDLAGLEEVDADATEGTLRLYEVLARTARARDLEGLAVRCWPETFTEMGCAVCGAMAMLNDDEVPCACEADVMGDATNLLLQELAGAPPWVVDLVDADEASDTAVLWHCGLAPLAMADPESTPYADVHANRKKPLLRAFPLQPGRITLARLSQARNEPKLVIGGGVIERAPMSYSGTSAVVRFDLAVMETVDRLMALGLEHHVSFAYGEHRPALRALAGKLHLPLVELC